MARWIGLAVFVLLSARRASAEPVPVPPPCAVHAYGEPSLHLVLDGGSTTGGEPSGSHNGVLGRAAVGARLTDCISLDVKIGATLYTTSEGLHMFLGSVGAGGELELTTPVASWARLGVRVGIEAGGNSARLFTLGVRFHVYELASVGLDVFGSSAGTNGMSGVMFNATVESLPAWVVIGGEVVLAGVVSAVVLGVGSR